MYRIAKLSKTAKIFLATLAVFIVMYAAIKFFDITLLDFKSQMISFKKYCQNYPINGYAIFIALILVTTIFIIPVEMTFILLAGVIYDFWTGVTVVTVSRLLAAAVTLVMVRMFMDESHPRRKKYKPHYLIRKFEKHPNVGHFVARLAPLPDSMVNYTVAATKVRSVDYLAVSLIGMIPFTLLCVWVGDQLGTVNKMVNWLQ